MNSLLDSQNRIRSNCEDLKAYVMDLTDWVSKDVSTTSRQSDQAALRLKEEGNNHMKIGAWASALASYTEALAECESSNLKHVVLSNRALCYLKLSRYAECVKDCLAAVELGRSCKAWYRKGCAEAKLKRWTHSRRSLEQARIMTQEGSDDRNDVDAQLCMLSLEEMKYREEQTDQARLRACNIIPKWCANLERAPLISVFLQDNTPVPPPIVQDDPVIQPAAATFERYIPASVRRCKR